jgi:hypothetical protein
MKTLHSPKLQVRCQETKTPEACGCIYTAVVIRTIDGDLDLACVQDKPTGDLASVRRKSFRLAEAALIQAQIDLRKLAKKNGVEL